VVARPPATPIYRARPATGHGNAFNGFCS